MKRVFSKGPINFYSRSDPYYYFTNFYPARIELDGYVWPTTEHYFQAQKFFGTPYYDYIRSLPTPREAFQVSRLPQASEWVRGDWPSVKDRIMLKALRAKFTQDKHLRQLLLDTKDRKLVEHTTNDSYWGDGGDGSGQNQLGKLLMQVRSELKDAPLKDSSNMVTAKPRGLKRSNSFSNLSSVSSVSSSPFGSRDDSDSFLSKPRQTHFASPMTSRKFIPRQTTASQCNYRYSSQPSYSQAVPPAVPSYSQAVPPAVPSYSQAVPPARKFIPRQTTASPSNYRYSSQPSCSQAVPQAVPSYSQAVSNTYSSYQKPIHPSGASTRSFYGKSSEGDVSTRCTRPSNSTPYDPLHVGVQRHLPATPNSTSSSQLSSKPHTNKSSVSYNILSNVEHLH